MKPQRLLDMGSNVRDLDDKVSASFKLLSTKLEELTATRYEPPPQPAVKVRNM